MASISFIVPIFNLEKYIEACIDSIVGQMDNQDQLILVDDGSDDSSCAICKRYESSNVIVCKKSHQGVVSARKVGLNMATGDYVSFVDGDDCLSADYRKIVAKYIDDRKVDILQFAFSTFGGKRNHVIYPFANNGAVSGICATYMKNTNGAIGTLCNKVFKRDVLLESQHMWGEDICFGEDSVMAWAAMSRSQTIASIPDAVLYHYRQHEESTTHKYSPNLCENLDKQYAALRNIEWPKELKESWNDYVNRCGKDKVYSVVINETRRNTSLAQVRSLVAQVAHEAAILPDDLLHKQVCNWLVKKRCIKGTYFYIKLYRVYRKIRGT